jgi:hypothetical protein
MTISLGNNSNFMIHSYSKECIQSRRIQSFEKNSIPGFILCFPFNRKEDI